MNAYFSDQLAREHADRLMSDAAAFRRARRVRNSRRAASRTGRNESAADRSPGAVYGRPTGATHLVARPFIAVQSWLAAGQL